MTDNTGSDLNFIQIVFNAIMEFLETGHASVIHFPIIGILMGFGAAFSALMISISLDLLADWFEKYPNLRNSAYNFVDRFEFTSFALIILGLGGYVIAGVTGFLRAGSVSASINNDLLEFKVKLSIYVCFLLITPIFLKVYIGLVYKRNIFNNKSRIIPLLYMFPLIPSAIMTAVIAGAGGRYVYGHSILDTFGLGFLFPGE